MKILVTGFNSFAGVRVNPSEQVVRAIAERRRPGARTQAGTAEIVAEVLPTEYAAATRKLRNLIRTHHPDAVVCLGVAPRRVAISLERIALNLDDDATADNAGVIRRGRQIVRGGPDVYWSTLPLAALARALQRRGIKAIISNHAGAFLCNHAFYIARHEREQYETARARRGIPCGFIHLPGLRGGKSARERSLNRMIRAVECCLAVIRKRETRKRRG
jgi:pyroglutamyl-peptidase